MALRGSFQSLRNDVREAQGEIIRKAIMDFDFGNYGLDLVDEVKGEDWHSDLALAISSALLPDVPLSARRIRGTAQ